MLDEKSRKAIADTSAEKLYNDYQLMPEDFEDIKVLIGLYDKFSKPDELKEAIHVQVMPEYEPHTIPYEYKDGFLNISESQVVNTRTRTISKEYQDDMEFLEMYQTFRVDQFVKFGNFDEYYFIKANGEYSKYRDTYKGVVQDIREYAESLKNRYLIRIENSSIIDWTERQPKFRVVPIDFGMDLSDI